MVQVPTIFQVQQDEPDGDSDGHPEHKTSQVDGDHKARESELYETED